MLAIAARASRLVFSNFSALANSERASAGSLSCAARARSPATSAAIFSDSSRKFWFVGMGSNSVKRLPMCRPHCAPVLGVTSSILAYEPPVAVRAHQIYVRAGRQVIGMPAADFKVHGDRRAVIPQVVAVAGALGKGCAVSSSKHRLAFVLDKHNLAFQDVHELIFMTVPVPLTRPLSRWQSHQVDAERFDASRIAQPSARSSRAGFVEVRGIPGSHSDRNSSDVDLGHRDAPTFHMSGGRKQANLAGGRRLDGGVGPRVQT